MMRGLPPLALAVGLAATLAVPATPASAASRTIGCVSLGAGAAAPSLVGGAAVTALGSDLAVAAATNHVSSAVLAGALEHDRTARLDPCGRMFYAEATVPPTVSVESASAATTSSAGLVASGDAFALSSRPASLHTIYLDFTGFTLRGTAWNTPDEVPDGRTLAPFDTDGDPAHFSTAELGAIRSIWLSVAEDYAPFDVDVTTAAPAAGVLERTTVSDQQFGTRAVITNDATSYPSICPGGCGGIAFVDVFSLTGSAHEFYQPAIVFQRGLSSNIKAIAEATAHEVGHNLGLMHDGTSTLSYYTGLGAWAPIMGASYYRPLTQWSRGEYLGANDKQDDIALIASHTGYATDESGVDDDSAAPLSSGVPFAGVIASSADADWYQFMSYGGSATVTVAPAWYAPDLDVRVDVFGADGALVATVNPPTSTADTRVSSLGGPIAGLDAAWSVPALPAGHYALRVTGTGSGYPTSTGYSSYSSIGRYTIEATAAAPPSLVVASSTMPQAIRGVGYAAAAVAGGASGTPTWTLRAGALPAGLALDATSGVISGTPETAGVASFTLEVSDDSTRVAARTISLPVYEPVGIRTPSFAAATLGRRYVTHATATGGDGSYVWTRVAGTLPPGVVLTPSGVVSGTPTRSGRFAFTLRGADYAGGAMLAGRTSTRAFAITVAKPVVVRTTALRAGAHAHAYASRVYAVGGNGHYWWTVRAGSLPPGMALSTTGRITGTPRRAGRWSVTVMVRDTAGRTALRSFVIRVR